jgi:hypothetical protein
MGQLKAAAVHVGDGATMGLMATLGDRILEAIRYAPLEGDVLAQPWASRNGPSAGLLAFGESKRRADDDWSVIRALGHGGRGDGVELRGRLRVCELVVGVSP